MSVSPARSLAPGESLREANAEVWRDHHHRLVNLRRVDRLTTSQLVDIVERIRATLWFSEESIDDGEADTTVRVPNVEDGGVGGADAVDMVVAILESHGLNPSLRRRAA